MPSVACPSLSDFPVFAPVRCRARGIGAISATPLPPRNGLPLVRYPSGRRHRTAENPCPTVFRPFFTVFDRFPDLPESKFVREIRHSTVFRTTAAVKKRRKRWKQLPASLPQLFAT